MLFRPKYYSFYVNKKERLRCFCTKTKIIPFRFYFFTKDSRNGKFLVKITYNGTISRIQRSNFLCIKIL